ncbi:MAG: AAA family ATPase [Selenomonas sp.]|nr:AAA family ATPase [Selenomonas sp.]
MQELKRPMPVGIEDFKRLVTDNYYFIDKTRFIKELIDTQGVVTLITRPRRFGKTLSLSMLQYFFTLENAAENRQLFAGLDIERAGEKYMNQQGTRPVVFLTLKEVRRPSHTSMLAMLASLLQEIYEQQRCILDSNNLEEPEAEYFKLILAGKGSEEDMAISLKRLMAYMEKHYGTQPVLLLDEYDAPILSAWENGYYQECIDFMRGFLGAALKTNPALGFAVLTGITRISKESIFSGLNNLKVCSVLSNRYSDIFGFTQEEAAKLLTECGAANKVDELAKWYDGYQFGQTEIYNPWSVIQYIDNDYEFRPYWLNTSGNSILKDLLAKVDRRRQKELEGLLHGVGVDAPVMEEVVYADLAHNRDALFMMLMTAGYLKSVKTWKDEEYADWALLKIPNLEVRMAYRKEILGHIVPSQGETLLRDMLHSMATGDTDGFSEHLSCILQDFVSYHDTAQPESFYHGLMLGFSVLLDGKYRVESNRESGYGRFDLAFFPLHPGAPGVILELKAAASEEELEVKAKEALAQIADKEYTHELSRQGTRNIWSYGIALYGKKVCMQGTQD